MMDRRSLITGLVNFIAAPAVVRASALMPVKSIVPYTTVEWTGYILNIRPEWVIDAANFKIVWSKS